jgi:CheY-like chemotaxis protein
MRNSSRRVLLVDDNRDAVDMLSQLLDCFDVENKVAYNGHSAVELLKEWPADLVFLDIQMPIMDGFETAAAMHALPGCENLPIIALTGWEGVGSQDSIDMARFSARLSKPVALQKILDVINRLAGSRA